MVDYTDEQVKILNAHRGAELAQQATGCSDSTREKIATLLEADECQCVDCGGNEYRHVNSCTHMNNLHA